MTTQPPRFSVLLLHGFTGNPYTMRPLQAPLEFLGVEVSPPLLRGLRGIFAASVDRRHLG
jgi:esterase/lipase